MNWRQQAAAAVEKKGHPRTDKTDRRGVEGAFVSNVSADPAPFSSTKVAKATIDELGYTLDELSEMDKLIREIAECEEWPQEALEAVLADRKRMAPVAVPDALQALRKAHREAVGRWPDTPAEKTTINLLEGWQ